METKLLNTISGPSDVKELSYAQLNVLCSEIRQTLIDTVSKNGGHLASNLGVVELTVALHKVFDCPQDALVWDVGHQSYVHKLLTGRRDRFGTIRTQGGLSGFPKHEESEYDAFLSGHASTSISVACGLARAKSLKREKGSVVAVIGDGAMTGGMVYEGLNNCGRAKDRLIIVLNDNAMSISKNVGALSKYFSTIRNDPNYFKAKDRVGDFLEHVPLVGDPAIRAIRKGKNLLKDALYSRSTLFDEFGFTYLGPVDGHDLHMLCDVLSRAKSLQCPVVVNVVTTKGKGYLYAEENPGAFHGIPKFDVITGHPDVQNSDSFSHAFGLKLADMADRDNRLCAVTAAMKYGTELQHFAARHRSHFFDVGIAEEHAVTFCGGLAAGGMKPVFAVYSTFLQRGFDQIIHDLSIERQHVVLAVDRAGIVGEDGETHQGIFDAAYLSLVPGITVFSPTNYRELSRQLERAVNDYPGVVAIRYPRGGEDEIVKGKDFTDEDYYLQAGDGNSKILLVSYGREFAEVLKGAVQLHKRRISVDCLKLNRITPIPKQAVELACRYDYVLFFEEGIRQGGIGEQFAYQLTQKQFRETYRLRAIDSFVPQGRQESLLAELNLDSGSIAEFVGQVITQ